jgi:hypothetical protein
MQKKPVQRIALSALSLAACAALCAATGGAGGHARADARAAIVARAAQPRLPARLVVAQNPSLPYTVQQTPEQPVSPINPGTLPGSTAAIGGSAAGTNPITGLPCNGGGSLSISGAGGLPATATAPPGLSNETLDQIPVGTPPTTSIYGSQSSLGPC